MSRLKKDPLRPLLYDAAAKERILTEFRRPPDRQLDGTATWSLTTLQRALRRAPDGLPGISTNVRVWFSGDPVTRCVVKELTLRLRGSNLRATMPRLERELK